MLYEDKYKVLWFKEEVDLLPAYKIKELGIKTCYPKDWWND